MKWLIVLISVVMVLALVLLLYVVFQKAEYKNMNTLNPTIFKNNTVHVTGFTGSQELANWRITNDGVMGGKSQGRIIQTQDSVLFTGEVSLANNGGFTSTFRPITPLAANQETITINAQGDGHVYQLRLNTIVDGYRLSYKHEFSTSLDNRQKITFKLSDFKASFRGRDITNAPELKSEDIVELGFLLNLTKLNIQKPQPFSLSIFNLTLT
ncbi:CIA30 family protein [uncultured Psychrosphaera sp.]|uniref:CIA30 family protein n=1 Tax=uncultured Psychrosphaera sp. TaxID=1403522 RepID=UPI0026062AAE|nr:CIA30 family protein [uncultured Psychrosphaera sp.]